MEATRRMTVKRLSNFVIELINTTMSGRESSVNFENPREGWILVRARSSGPSTANRHLFVDADPPESPVLILRKGIEEAEAMAYMKAGIRRLTLEADAHHETSICIRAIPEIIYANYPGNPHLKEYGEYDWGFLDQVGMLASANVIITGNPEGPWIEQWTHAGGRILQQVGVPGLRRDETIDGESAYTYWSQSTGWRSDAADGLIADEFLTHRDPKVPAWSDAIHRLLAERPDRVFYPYIGGDPEDLESLLQSLADTSCRFAWERYLKEQPTEEEAWKCLETRLKEPVRRFSSTLPGFPERLVVVLGILCGPPETLNTNPSVDYKVFMDMQFNLIANDPAFEGIYGIEEYLSSYADEEYLRWAAHLYRHYCIEGRRERATLDPYQLDHLYNPDFARGLEGWTTASARSGSIGVEEMEGIGWLQGRYPKGKEGDRYLFMTLSPEGPNIVSQDVRNLARNRVYSLKMYVWDPDNLTQEKEHAVGLRIEGAENLPDLSFNGRFPSCYSHKMPRLGEGKAWFNFARMVFRPRDHEVRLEISDWMGSEPAGPLGQRLAVNFVEIEPFFMGGLDLHGTP